MDNSNGTLPSYGHRRQPALGKSMPVTALLLNMSGTGVKASHARNAADEYCELPPRYFNVAKTDEPEPPSDDEELNSELLGRRRDYVPCRQCTQSGPTHLTQRDSAINEMCQRLCNDDCRKQLSLTGFMPQSVQQAAADAAAIAQRRKEFREKYEIAEALAKTSAMTSTAQMKQRLAARKLEMESTGSTAANEAAELGVVDAGAAHAGDMQPPLPPALLDYEPPRDLLLYLVRMGSFNSAPKINNVDSQDDGLELPKGLTTSALLQHVQQLRGCDQPPLLPRYFVKPQAPIVIGDDVTDALRSLKLNTLTRVCSSPVSSAGQHIRLLQWNLLSQTLGVSNDGFVRCPKEALSWDHRKYLIVQEILQNQPDVVCLQEVDHFKFLQNILGSQNYEGIFYPKPDSPCLYIEENNGPDGCAIFYKRDKFNLQHYDTRVLEVWRVQSNQVAIAARLQVKATGREFCVCTTHLKARHGALLAKLRNEQGRDLVRFVKQFAGSSPVLLCGDFNAEPIEPIYATILGCDILKLSSAYADVKLEQEQKQLTKDAAVEDVNEFVAQSIKREPPYTTWKIREDGEVCHTIDYVFYTPEQLKIKNCLDFPAGDEIGQNRTPCIQYPSDHFSLVCDFELLDTPKSQNTNLHGNIQ